MRLFVTAAHDDLILPQYMTIFYVVALLMVAMILSLAFLGATWVYRRWRR